MARKQPDYRKAAEEASAALTKMKIEHGHLHGFYLGSGDRQWAIERLRRWCDLAEEHLSTEMIDQMALRIQMYLSAEAVSRLMQFFHFLDEFLQRGEQDCRDSSNGRRR